MDRPIVSLAVSLSARSQASPPAPAPAPIALPPPPPLSQAEVRDFVQHYVAATNEADPSKLLAMVSHEAAVSSAGLGKVSRGWEAIQRATLEATASGARFKVAMGAVDVTLLGPDLALAVATMTLSPQPAQAGRASIMRDAPGAATMIVKRFPEGLRLLHEHYSLGAQ